MKLFSAIVLVGLAACQPYTPSEVQTMRGFFENNLDVSGCFSGFVVAAPSHSGPDYYYHWQRDAAISMYALFQTTNSSDFNPKFQNYVKWSENAYGQSDPNGIDVIGEPKFFCAGGVYNGGWCRPQNDGPALKAKALAAYAKWLLTQPNGAAYVKQHLYSTNGSSPSSTCSVPNDQKKDCGQVGTTQQQCLAKGCCWQPEGQHSQIPWCYFKGGSGGGGGLIPQSLDYVQAHWQDGNNCDLWEEIRGKHFFTLMVQRKGLLDGADLAKQLGDSSRASAYTSTASNMVNDIKSFQNGNIIQDDQRQQDCSVAVASLYGGTSDLFGPSDPTILATINSFRNYYKGSFSINKQDDSAGVPGTLIGRYANDKYAGCSGGGSAGTNQGHAWILCTNAYGDIYYHNSMAIQKHVRARTAHKFLDVNRLKIYAETFRHDQPRMSSYVLGNASVWETLSVDAKHEVAQAIANALVSEGDGMLIRVKHHTQPCGLHMSEQICETNGNCVGAPDLTWSYGTVLQAMYSRQNAIDLGATAVPFEKKYQPRKNPFAKPDAACSNCQNQCA